MSYQKPLNVAICNTTSYEWPLEKIKNFDKIPFGQSYTRTCHENSIDLHQKILDLYSKQCNITDMNVLVVPSGMNAIYLSIFSIMKNTFLNAKPKILFMNELYCDSPKVIIDLCNLFQWNNDNFSDGDDLLKKMDKDVSIVFFESASNPTGKMIDPIVLKKLKQSFPNTIIIMDNSWLSITAKDYLLCADIIVESASKYLGGGEIIMGIIIGKSKLVNVVYTNASRFGNHVSPTDCSKAVQSLKTLPLRMDHCLKLMDKVIEYLKLKEISYFHSSNNLDYGIKSAIVTFKSPYKKEETFDKLSNFNFIKFATSYGKAETLIDPYLLRGRKIMIRLAIGYNSTFKEISSDLKLFFND